MRTKPFGFLPVYSFPQFGLTEQQINSFCSASSWAERIFPSIPFCLQWFIGSACFFTHPTCKKARLRLWSVILVLQLNQTAGILNLDKLILHNLSSHYLSLINVLWGLLPLNSLLFKVNQKKRKRKKFKDLTVPSGVECSIYNTLSDSSWSSSRH